MVPVLYISAPMGGIKDDNFPAFMRETRHFRRLGWVVINPAESFGGRRGLPRSMYLRMDLGLMLQATHYHHIEGFPMSRGSYMEAIIAVNLEMPWVSRGERPPKEWPVKPLGTISGVERRVCRGKRL